MNWYFDVWKKYAVFSGRARRKEFWFFTLVNAIIKLVLLLLAFSPGLPGSVNLLFFILIYAYAFAIFLPSLGVVMRRLHDTGRSGWWCLIPLIPIIGAIVLLVFTVQDSQPGSNQYGANPKEAIA